MSALSVYEAYPTPQQLSDEEIVTNINGFYLDIAERVTGDEKYKPTNVITNLYHFDGRDGFAGDLFAKTVSTPREAAVFRLAIVSRVVVDNHTLHLPKTFSLVWAKNWPAGRPEDSEPLAPADLEGCPIELDRLHGVLEAVHARLLEVRPQTAATPGLRSV
jgi:hypothetical protein